MDDFKDPGKTSTQGPTPRVTVIISQLEKIIKQQAEAGKNRLPTIHTLTKEIGASPVTLCKALSFLRARGIVIASQRGGIRIVKDAVDSSFELRQKPQSTDRSDEPVLGYSLRQRILNDLLIGALSPDGSLPSIKELKARYGASFYSIKRVVVYGIEQGILLQRGRRFRLNQGALRRSRNRLVVIARADSMKVLAANTPRSSEFWHLLEYESANRGLELDVWSFEKAIHIFRSRIKATAPDQKLLESIYGYIVLTQDAVFDELHTIVAGLAPMLRPVAVLDEVGRVTIPSLVSANPLMRLIVTASSTSPGRIVGNYLLGLGHKKAAFFSSMINDSWSHNRWLGLLNAFSGAGYGDGAARFGVDSFDEWQQLYQGIGLFSKITAALGKVQKMANASSTNSPKILLDASAGALWRLRLEAILLPLFENALNDKTITAWVGENDDVALKAMVFLSARGIKVPQEISVIGFDDTIDGLGAGLTSLNFNMPALVQATINHIFTARSNKRLLNKGPLEIPGALKVRGSSGPAKNMTQTGSAD